MVACISSIFIRWHYQDLLTRSTADLLRSPNAGLDLSAWLPPEKVPRRCIKALRLWYRGVGEASDAICTLPDSHRRFSNFDRQTISTSKCVRKDISQYSSLI